MLALLGLVEEPLHQVTRPVEMGLKQMGPCGSPSGVCWPKHPAYWSIPHANAHVLLPVPRDAGPVLVRAYDRRINHLHGRVMSDGQRLHDLVPDASPPPSARGMPRGSFGSIGLMTPHSQSLSS